MLKSGGKRIDVWGHDGRQPIFWILVQHRRKLSGAGVSGRAALPGCSPATANSAADFDGGCGVGWHRDGPVVVATRLALDRWMWFVTVVVAGRGSVVLGVVGVVFTGNLETEVCPQPVSEQSFFQQPVTQQLVAQRRFFR